MPSFFVFVEKAFTFYFPSSLSSFLNYHNYCNNAISLVFKFKRKREYFSKIKVRVSTGQYLHAVELDQFYDNFLT